TYHRATKNGGAPPPSNPIKISEPSPNTTEARGEATRGGIGGETTHRVQDPFGLKGGDAKPATGSVAPTLIQATSCRLIQI
ncbi:hypothetical protein A2U01_0062160, partial [Trifolium medium]|nr:hypothetical protein [Trifolium medium]